MECSLPGSFVHRIILARLLERVAISSSMGSSRPRDQTWVSCSSFIGRWIVYQWATWIEYLLMCLLVASVSSLEKRLFKFLAHFKITWLSFCCWVLGILYSQLALEQRGSGLTQTCECFSLVKYYRQSHSEQELQRAPYFKLVRAGSTALKGGRWAAGSVCFSRWHGQCLPNNWRGDSKVTHRWLITLMMK